MRTGFICDESYFWHDTGNGALFLPPGGWVETDVHSENPATKRRFKNLLERCRLMNELEVVAPREASREEVELYHTSSYIDKVKELSDTTGGDAGDIAIVGKGSYEIAMLSVGGAITAVDAVMQGKVKNAYALTRPPGHHAEAEQGRGFCIFNNVAIAAKYAKMKYQVKRILVLDWDVHHGNGTQKAFYSDPDVLFISLHQEGYYPHNEGFAEEVGEGAGKGLNVNIPLPAGTGNAGYLYAFEQVIAPIVDQFKPELMIISAGQDASAFDPLARMMVTAEGYRQISSIMVELADKYCQGRLVACHEGGYSAAYVPFCSLRIIESFSGKKSGVEDPFEALLVGLPINELYASQKEAIEHVMKVHSEYWKL